MRTSRATSSLVWRTLVALLVLVGCLGAASADSGRGKHAKMYAVPCPGPVTIDGQLKDWDLSGQLFMYIVSETSDVMSTKFALMYDREALYLSGDVRDDSPMMNRYDPQVNAPQGWNADSCQFRIILDPAQGYPVTQSSFTPTPNAQMAHLTLWYYTDRQEPVLQLQTGMDYAIPHGWPLGVAPHDAYQAAYLKKTDGKGYTFEYRIPWSTLGAKAPLQAGDLVAGTVQINYSTPDGLSAGGGWLYDVMSGPGFTFQDSGCWGKIAFTDRNNLPHELVEDSAPPEKPLPLTFSYTLPVASEVSLQLCDATGMVVRTLLASAPRPAGTHTEQWDGLNEDGTPLTAGTYQLKGLYHQPLRTKFLLSVHNSGTPPYKTDDNTGGWGGDHGTPQCVTALGDTVLMGWSYCESGWGIIRTDANGRKLWGSKSNAMDIASDGVRIFTAYGSGDQPSIKVYDITDARPINWATGQPQLIAPAGGDATSNIATAVTCGNGKMYVAWTARNLVGVYDDGGMLLATWPVPAPGRMAVQWDGRLLVLSQGKVLRIRDGAVVTLVTQHLDTPTGIARDATGNIYVANRGALQNVSVFSPDGSYLRSIGKVGGRPRLGRYDRTGMLEPGGIAIDGHGRLWVTETLDGPKRISVWETRNGKLWREFFGGSAYSTFVSMDPKHADTVYCHQVQWQIDLKRGAWQPVSTCWRPDNVNSPECSPELRVFTAKNGRQYAWGDLHAKGPVLYLRDGDIFKPILMLLRSTNSHSLTPWPAYPFMSDIKQYPNGTYAWVDGNNDQTMQDTEMTYLNKGKPEWEQTTFNWVDADLNLWSGGGMVFRPLTITQDGIPVYDFLKPEKTGVTGNNGEGPLWVDPQDGSLYSNAPGSTPGFARYTPDGKLLWGYTGAVDWHSAINMPPVTAGKLWGPTMPLGVAGDFTGLATYFGPYQLYTRDGLFVGMVMRDGRLGGGLGADIIACENFCGQLVKPEGMNRYFLLAGDQDGRVTEILGLDTVQRLPVGSYTQREEDVQAVTKAQTAYAAQLASGSRCEIGRGGLAGLPAARALRKVVDATRQFTVRASYDATNLYVAYDVTSPYELVNSTPDPQRIFKGGNLLDIQLATEAQADPERTTPAPGDLRILVTRQQGQPVAVLFRPKVAGFTGDPIVLTSPTGTESFDAIEVTPEITLDYRAGKGGFTATVTIPLRLLHWTPQPGAAVRMDVGYIFAKNAQGSQVAMRAYWKNNSFSANVVDDVPNESRLEPAQWGTAFVE